MRFMNPFWLNLIGALLRKLLTVISAALVTHHILTNSGGETFTKMAFEYVMECLPGAIAAFWAYANQKDWRVKFLTALTQPVGTTENDIKEIIKSGTVTPTVSTPPHTIPGVPSNPQQQETDHE
jgi:hypothetical protein